MGLIESAVEGAVGLYADMGGAPAPWDDFWYTQVGGRSSTGMRVDPYSSLRIAAVYACCSVIGRMVASFPAGIFQEDAKGGKKLLKQHPVYRLIATAPNRLQTPFEFRQMLQGHLELRGNAYSEIRYGRRSTIDELLPMHPDRVTVERLSTGRPRYRYNDPLTNQDRNLAPEEVFHLRNWSDDGLIGQSTVSIGADIFGVALSAQEYTARFFQNDATPRGIIEGGAFKTKADELAFRESWQRGQTRHNRHKIGIMPTGMQFKEIAIKPSDAQLLDARKFSRIEICSMFGVPPHLIGETEKTATYASVEQFNIMFATQCIWPRLVNWEQTIWRDLIQDEGYFAKFSMAALMRGDTAARYTSYQTGFQNGWLSDNDIRMMEDLNPIEGGDQYFRPTGVVPLLSAAPAPNQGLDTADPSAEDPGQSGSPDPAALAECFSCGRSKACTSSPKGPVCPGCRASLQATEHKRLELLAGAAAERCVRKEVSAVRKLLERNADAVDFAKFYNEQAQFIADVLRISVSQASDCYSSRHCELLINPGATADDRLQLAEGWARTGTRELAALAIGEVKP